MATTTREARPERGGASLPGPVGDPPPGTKPARRARRRAAMRAVRARLAARDPGWRRARKALGATSGAALALVLTTALTTLASQSKAVALLGAVVAMVSGLSVTEDDRRTAAVTFALLPFAAAASVAAGAALSMNRLLADAVFIVIVFGATTVRRRGPRWSAVGFLVFMAFFFSQFLHAVPAQVPWLAASATIGVAVAAVLRLVVLPERPERTLRSLVQALEGQAAALLDAAVDVLEAARVTERLRRRIVGASSDLNRVALLVEQQLGVGPEADTDGDTEGEGESLRDRVFLVEVAAAHVLSAVRAAVREGLPVEAREDLVRDVTAVARAVRSGRSPRALQQFADSVRAEPVATPESDADPAPEDGRAAYRGARHVRRALAELAEAAAALQAGARSGDVLGVWGAEGDDDADDDAESSGASPALRIDPHLGIRQGLQATVAVALAILAGELLSPARWYWAAIAAYIVFVGADTRNATVKRALARTVGTFGGLLLGLVVAALVSGSTPAVLVVLFLLLFAAWWLQPVSFLASTVCVTVVLALLYVLLGTYSGSVLLLRVEETAIGALLGGLASLVLVPSRGSPVVREAEADVLDELADLLQAIRRRTGSGTAMRALDTSFQTLRDVARPVAKGVPGVAARRIEQRVFALSAASYSARMLVTALVRVPELDDDLAGRLDRLAERAAALAASARSGDAEDPVPASEQPPGLSAPHGSGPGHPHPSASHDDAGRNRMHARVALERLDLALTRWSDPLRAPLATTPGSTDS